MSSDPSQPSVAPAYDDAEKGTLEVPPPTQIAYPADIKKDPFTKDEKSDVIHVVSWAVKVSKGLCTSCNET